MPISLNLGNLSWGSINALVMNSLGPNWPRIVLVLAMVFLLPLQSRAELQQISSQDFTKILAKYVDANGLVNYRGLKAERTDLDSFISTLGDLAPDQLAGYSASEKIAFYINSYNAFTLRVIIDNYPIKAGFFKGLAYPKNSIRQISGAWDKVTHRLAGSSVTLDQIEHEILRKQFSEPRIHLALVCAARGCPLLRNEAYLAADLEQQFADQAESMLADPLKFRIDSSTGVVFLSAIFDWFGQDFVAGFAQKPDFASYEPKQRAVLNFIAGYLDLQQKSFLLEKNPTVEFLDYDWSLNEQP